MGDLDKLLAEQITTRFFWQLGLDDLLLPLSSTADRCSDGLGTKHLSADVVLVASVRVQHRERFGAGAHSLRWLTVYLHHPWGVEWCRTPECAVEAAGFTVATVSAGAAIAVAAAAAGVRAASTLFGGKLADDQASFFDAQPAFGGVLLRVCTRDTANERKSARTMVQEILTTIKDLSRGRKLRALP
jgi:hypothetical protein